MNRKCFALFLIVVVAMLLMAMFPAPDLQPANASPTATPTPGLVKIEQQVIVSVYESYPALVETGYPGPGGE